MSVESIFKCKLASRGWHFYGKTIWKSPKQGEILKAEEEKNKEALLHDPYSITWKRKCKGKLIAEVVGHVPREISRAVNFFLKRGGKLIARVSDCKYRRSPIANGGLEIPLMATFLINEEKKRYLDRMKVFVETNYDDQFVPEEFDRNDFVDLLCPGEAEPRDSDSNDHIIDDESDDDLIVID